MAQRRHREAQCALMSRRMLASATFFSYAFRVKRQLLHFWKSAFEFSPRCATLLAFFLLFAWDGSAANAGQQQTPSNPALAVTKVEPPSWWVGLTPEVMLLLSGHDLEATHVGCNLPTLRVSRTQATAGGNYLFVWLKIGADTKSRTAVCRIEAPKGS